MDIGKRIRALRQRRGLSQEEVARQAGFTLGTISALERGISTDPHYSTLASIAAVLEVTVAELAEDVSSVPLDEAQEATQLVLAKAASNYLDVLSSLLFDKTLSARDKAVIAMTARVLEEQLGMTIGEGAGPAGGAATGMIRVSRFLEEHEGIKEMADRFTVVAQKHRKAVTNT